MSKLMIVESPHKAKEIGKFLGSDYVVMASYGHIRDLPATGEEPGELVVGVAEDFSARYEIGERARGAVAKLRDAASKAERVVLATDPDREGEAIAWHLQQVLRLKNPERVTYQEITAKAVKAALAQPRGINLELVHAQEGRRVLDRLVGYAVSPILSKQSGQKLSAGRVQTPALRLVVEVEEQIRAFQQRLHYGAELAFAGGWKATWSIKPHLAEGEEYWTDMATATAVAGIRRLSVLAFTDGKASEAPPAPFTTSTLQQEGGKRFGLSVKEVMDAAQALFDSGLITYHRTDSPNFLEEGFALISAYAQQKGLPLAPERRQWKAKASAQEGHEAIRPVDFVVESAGSSENERKLYELIRMRALASQLADATYATRKVQLRALDGQPVNGKVPEFEAKGRVLVDRGWRVIYAGDAKDEGEGESDAEAELSNPIPVLAVGAEVVAETGRRLDRKTEPPKRYTEAGLVKKLEALGIGRPSTYASIIGNIQTRSYVVPGGPKGKHLVPTKTGEALVNAVRGKCRFADYDFTAAIEDELDQVATGNRPASAVVGTAWRQLEGELPKLQMGSTGEPEHKCPDCGRAMRRIKGASGFFWGCTGYSADPPCKTTLPDARGKPGKRVEASAEHKCDDPACGKPLIHRVKKATKANKGFDFWGCSGFPTCKRSYKTGPDGKPIMNGK
ncbi:type I DNA topoisomerase [Ancylobacter oerskovii]|uniref:DNA topoisomerase 1 n=1 Tax=Ancylobacter oerskovii TaxID=459519 RepID=A0ABW4Z696_9HYPH|nr:type I DNA topoisomerase [Ancylobacter oerskovii]MBS7545524.1 type I DNA topoisomerase [Ancylobacter oerskovii]